MDQLVPSPGKKHINIFEYRSLFRSSKRKKATQAPPLSSIQTLSNQGLVGASLPLATTTMPITTAMSAAAQAVEPPSLLSSDLVSERRFAEPVFAATGEIASAPTAAAPIKFFIRMVYSLSKFLFSYFHRGGKLRICKVVSPL
jgi:hypothetical protein